MVQSHHKIIEIENTCNGQHWILRLECHDCTQQLDHKFKTSTPQSHHLFFSLTFKFASFLPLLVIINLIIFLIFF